MSVGMVGYREGGYWQSGTEGNKIWRLLVSFRTSFANSAIPGLASERMSRFQLECCCHG
jgi:hypothetical protein